jgi:hypothetical protein
MMLDVHPPHKSLHGWRDFFVHLATITIGLLIALGLEATAEWMHHRHEVSETREALQHELQENRAHFALNTAHFRRESSVLQKNLLVLRFLQQHPGAPPSQLPGTIQWNISYTRMVDSAWKTACQTGITALMPQEEVRKTAELYGFYERMDRSHEEEADALTDAISYGFEDSDPTHLSRAQINDELERTKRVLSKHLRLGYLMQNLSEEFPNFQPAPQGEELDQLVHLSEPKN